MLLHSHCYFNFFTTNDATVVSQMITETGTA